MNTVQELIGIGTSAVVTSAILCLTFYYLGWSEAMVKRAAIASATMDNDVE